MIHGTGIDSVSIVRIAATVARFGQRFADRLLHESERAAYNHARDKVRFLAKRFAIKEAASKALGTGIRQAVSWRDFAVSSNSLGKPELTLHGAAKKLSEQHNICRLHISLTDEREQVIAMAVFEMKE